MQGNPLTKGLPFEEKDKSGGSCHQVERSSQSSGAAHGRFSKPLSGSRAVKCRHCSIPPALIESGGRGDGKSHRPGVQENASSAWARRAGPEPKPMAAALKIRQLVKTPITSQRSRQKGPISVRFSRAHTALARDRRFPILKRPHGSIRE